MTLEEASRAAQAAAQAGNWEALEQALDAREQALASGSPVTEQEMRIGEEIRSALLHHRTMLRREEARLQQIESVARLGPSDPGIVLNG